MTVARKRPSPPLSARSRRKARRISCRRREVLTYLRANGFKTFIVSGGGIEFMRPWTERVYGIPPEQVA
jgi:phosphoserine phosphatase